MSSPADTLLLSLYQYQLLDSARLAEIRAWATERAPDPASALRELTSRGWLTPFQARNIAAGKLRDLTVGKFILMDLLGEGGMGRVYKARDTRLGRVVGLKVIRKEKLSNPKVVERFEQEIKAAAQLNHPNVVMAFDAEASEKEYFLSMEYVDGTDLTKLVVQNGPMPIQHACEAIRQAAVGLQHAHERGLVHRDIKPSNLLYTPRGQVKLLDLGLAQLSRAVIPGGENANRVTQEGFVLGTPDFLAPEQAQSPAGVDTRADIYALGATLYFLLTARVPYEGNSPTEKMLKHITESPPNLLAVRPDAPPQLASLIAWMMAKKPEDRPQTPSQVAMALAPFGLSPSPNAHPGMSSSPPISQVNQPFAEVLQSDPEFVGGNAFTNLNDPSTEESVSEPMGENRRRSRREHSTVRVPSKASSVPLLVIGFGVVLLVCVGVISVAAILVSQALEAVKPLEPEYTTTVGNIRLVKVEPGTFEMGSTSDEVGHTPDEEPMRSVTLTRPFYISTHEITRQQYFDVIGKFPSLSPPRMSDKYLPRIPATVSWNEAQEFLNRLNLRENGGRSGWAFRLPTEAEWEYCARTGKSGPFGGREALRQYRDGIFRLSEEDTYGESIPEITAPYQFEEMPCPVGQSEQPKGFDYPFRREPNEWGLYDMAGNVWELCQDRYDNYPEGPATDPSGPATGTQRVARGGAFDTTATRCRAAARKIIDPGKATLNVGFRIVYGPKLTNE